MADSVFLTVKRNDTDPIVEYPVLDSDDNPVDFTNAKGVTFTMGSKAYLPNDIVGTGDGVKAYGIIKIDALTFAHGDGITIDTEFIEASNVSGTGWADGVLSITGARNKLLAQIGLLTGLPIIATSVSSDSILIAHTSWDADVGNACVFSEIDTASSMTLTPDTGTLGDGVTPTKAELTFNVSDAFLQTIEIGSVIRIEYANSMEILLVGSIDYQTGIVELDRGDNPCEYYATGSIMWNLKTINETASITGEDKNILTYEWAAIDTDIAGRFYGQFTVEKDNDKLQTYPLGNPLVIVIEPDIEDE